MRLLAGKPLLQYTIEAALKSEKLSYIFLSSDNEEIIEFARRFKIDTDYKRPTALAQDSTSTADTVLDGLEWLKATKHIEPRYIVLLQPTSPLRTSADIDSAIDAHLAHSTQSLVSVHKMLEHPCNCLVSSKVAGWHYLSPRPGGVNRRQDFPDDFYFINGAIYIRNTEAFLREKTFVVDGESHLFNMPEERGIDINTMLDLAIAEGILNSCFG
jgi:N-acylneuraminate cytidylyltransferase/CMP-N,N'-diacetyllegionaminic acid synthase